MASFPGAAIATSSSSHAGSSPLVTPRERRRGRVLHHDPFRRRADQPSQEGAVPDVHERGAAQEHGSPATSCRARRRRILERSSRLAPLTPSPVPAPLSPLPAGDLQGYRRPSRARTTRGVRRGESPASPGGPRPPPSSSAMDFSADGASLGTIVVGVPGPRPRLRQGVHPPRHRRGRRPRRLHLLREHPRSQNRGRRPRRGRSRVLIRGAVGASPSRSPETEGDASPTSTRASSLSPFDPPSSPSRSVPARTWTTRFRLWDASCAERRHRAALSATTSTSATPRRRARESRRSASPRVAHEARAAGSSARG